MSQRLQNQCSETAQDGQMFIPYVKTLFDSDTEFQSNPAILAAIGHSANKKKTKQADARL